MQSKSRKSNQRKQSSVDRLPKRTTIVVFGFCRPGFLVVLSAYVLLFCVSAWLVLFHGKSEYFWAPIAYGAISAVGLHKTAMLWWKNRHRGWLGRFFRRDDA